jgi:hypothetical protein
MSIGEVLVFPNHAVPGAFYYPAPSPRIRRTGGHIPYTKGTVSLIALDAGTTVTGGRPQFVEKVLAGGTQSLVGDLRAIFWAARPEGNN